MAQYWKAYKHESHAFLKSAMSLIPTQVTEQQFAQFFDPYLNQADHRFVSRILRYKLFNYILFWLHTGYQWDEILIDEQVGSQKRNQLQRYLRSVLEMSMTAI